MKASAALRTGSVETPLGLISNRPGTTSPLVVIPLNGIANPLLSYSSDIWRKRSVIVGCALSLRLAEGPWSKNGTGDER